MDHIVGLQTFIILLALNTSQSYLETIENLLSYKTAVYIAKIWSHDAKSQSVDGVVRLVSAIVVSHAITLVPTDPPLSDLAVPSAPRLPTAPVSLGAHYHGPVGRPLSL